MELHFKITNQKLEQRDTDFLVQKSNNYLKLFFDFQTEDWQGLSKFVIMRDHKGLSYQFYHSDDGVIVPSTIVDGKFFYVSVYGGDVTTKRITTNELKIGLAKTGYTRDIHSITDEEIDIFVEIMELLDEKADIADLSAVAFTGKFEDLSDSSHTHTSSDVTDLEPTMGAEVKAGFRQLANRIRQSSS